MAHKHPCTDCPVRKTYARLFDVHVSGKDCPNECDRYRTWEKEHEEDTGDGVSQSSSPNCGARMEGDGDG